jgi:Immunity protein 8
MKPIINRYDCVDHDPIDSWVPEDPANVDFWMNFTIGSGGAAGDDFQVHVLTNSQVERSISTQYAIILPIYRWDLLLAVVEKILDHCQGEDWVEVSGKLSRYMHWEYQDYKP